MGNIPTYICSYIPRTNKMANLEKLDHSGILKIQRRHLQNKRCRFDILLQKKKKHDLVESPCINSYLCNFMVNRTWWIKKNYQNNAQQNFMSALPQELEKSQF